MKKSLIIITSIIILIGLAVSIFIYTNFEQTPPAHPTSTNSEPESSDPETNSDPEASESSEPEANSIPEIPYAEFPTDEQLAENPVGLENSLSDPPTDTQDFTDTINEETAAEIDRILQEIHDNTLTPEDYLNQPEPSTSTPDTEPNQSQQNQENINQQGVGGAPRPSGWAIDPGTTPEDHIGGTSDKAGLGSGGYN